MRYIPLFFLVSSIGFFALSRPSFYRPKSQAGLHHQLPGLPKGNKPGAYLWRALVTGNDQGFPRSEKRTYYLLGLGHLFTPSGIHLSYLSPILKQLRFTAGFLALLALLSAMTHDLKALSRVAWIKALAPHTHLPVVFCTVMLIEGMLLSWFTSYLSWVCSWLFLGLSWFCPTPVRIPWFTLAQLTLCWILMQPFSLISPLANILVSIPLALLFPSALFASFLPNFFLHHWIINALNWLHFTILELNQLPIPSLTPHAGHVLLGVFLLQFGFRRYQAIALAVLFLSSPVGESSKRTVDNSKWEITPHAQAYIIKRKPLQLYWSDGTVCRVKWKWGRWEERCRRSRSSSGIKSLTILSLRR
jgi:hypothetical protein